jgi:L-threonylcarbamoyladenylate synthase
MVAPDAVIDFAHYLYAGLRQLDQSGCAVIVVEAPPETPEWAAVRDRLQRAAAGAGATATSAETEAQADAT